MGKAKDFIREQIESDSKYIAITEFTKVDGQITKLLGEELYKLEFKLDIEYTKETNMYYNSFLPAYSNFKTYVGKETPDSWLKLKRYIFTKGEKVNLQGHVYFVNKDSGWQPIKYIINGFEFEKE